jgi:RNA polymerase sigma factor (sigma-70 family)
MARISMQGTVSQLASDVPGQVSGSDPQSRRDVCAVSPQRLGEWRGRGAKERTIGLAPGLDRLLTAAEERALASRIKMGDREAREVLIVSNLRLVVHIAKHFRSIGSTTLDDLIQEGALGLIRAAEDFDPQNHKTRFTTYAAHWIRHFVRRAVVENHSLLRVPTYLFQLRNRFQRLLSESATAVAVDPGPAKAAEVAARMGVTTRQIQHLLRSLSQPSPVAVKAAQGNEIALEASIADSHEPQLELEQAEETEEVHKALERLTTLEAWVIRRRFGLTDPSRPPPPASHPAADRRGRLKHGISRDKVARALRISKPALRKIEEVALRKLRECLDPEQTPARERL